MTPKQPKPGTQEARLLQSFQQLGQTTIRRIFIGLNINSPTKIISNLRAMGWDIQDEWVTGGLESYKRYWLES